MAYTARDLVEAERNFQTISERLPCVVYLAEYGEAGHWLYVSPRIQSLLGYSPEEWKADPGLWAARLHPEDRGRVLAHEAHCALEGLPLDVEYRLLTRDGRVVWVHDAAELAPSGDGPVSVEGILTDITARKRAEAELRHLADHDDLTGLVNRRRFEEILGGFTESDASPEGALVIIDLDHLKFVNDSLGHDVGDAAIRGLATALRTGAPEEEVAARLGGDEFAVLLPGADEEVAQRRVGEILNRVRAIASRAPITASAGIAVIDPAIRSSSRDLFAAADMALYDAKAAGRDRAALVAEAGTERLTWAGRVRSAIDEERLQLMTQPIVSMPTGKIIGSELLVRISEGGELIAPREWLPTAERFGMIREIDRWVAKRAIRYAATGKRVSMNVSGRTVADRDFTRLLEQDISDVGVDPQRLVFEITETAAAAAVDDLVEFAGRIERLGCLLAIDDFGTGFGSFTYLKHLPVHFLKIDMEFIRGMHGSVADQRIVRSMVAIATSLGMRTVAEGVEGERVMALLRDFGVDLAQGYHLGRPQAIDAELMSRHSR